MLYNENTFDFNHIDPLIDLPNTTGFQNLQSIQSLRLGWTFTFPFKQEVPYHFVGLSEDRWPPPPYDFPTWEAACEAIASMTGLKEIYMRLCGIDVAAYSDTGDTDFGQVLQPLCKIRDAAVFEVALNLVSNDENTLLQEFGIEAPPGAPFELSRLQDEW